MTTTATPADSPTRRSIQSLLHLNATPTPTQRQPTSKSNTTSTCEPPDQLLHTRNGQMPASFANLLALHGALENAILLHLSTQGANVAVTYDSSSTNDTSNYTPSHSVDGRMKTPEPEEYKPPSSDHPDLSSSVKTFRFENLISWPVVKPIVERASGRKFSEHQLAQLLWLWQNDPEDLQTITGQHGTSSEEKKLDDAQPEDETKVSSKEQVGMGFIVSCVRALEGITGQPNKKRISYTYGLGLEIKARENRQLPTYSLESPGKSNQFLDPSSPSNRFNQYSIGLKKKSPTNINTLRNSPRKLVKAREIMSLVALWSSKSIDRKDEIARRLRSYWLIHSNSSSSSHDSHIHDPSRTLYYSTPTRNQKNKLKNIKIPLGNLPNLQDPSSTKTDLTQLNVKESQDSPSYKSIDNLNLGNTSTITKRKLSKNQESFNSSMTCTSDDDDDDGFEFDTSCIKKLKSNLSPYINKTNNKKQKNSSSSSTVKFIVSSLQNQSPSASSSSISPASVQIRALNLLQRIKEKEEKLTSPVKH